METKLWSEAGMKMWMKMMLQWLVAKRGCLFIHGLLINFIIMVDSIEYIDTLYPSICFETVDHIASPTTLSSWRVPYPHHLQIKYSPSMQHHWATVDISLEQTSLHFLIGTSVEADIKVPKGVSQEWLLLIHCNLKYHHDTPLGLCVPTHLVTIPVCTETSVN